MSVWKYIFANMAVKTSCIFVQVVDDGVWYAKKGGEKMTNTWNSWFNCQMIFNNYSKWLFTSFFSDFEYDEVATTIQSF